MFFLLALLVGVQSSARGSERLATCLFDDYGAHTHALAAAVSSSSMHLSQEIDQIVKTMQIGRFEVSSRGQEESVDEALSQACAEGDKQTVAAILRSGVVNVNALNDQKLTPFQVAMQVYHGLSRPQQIIRYDGYIGTMRLLMNHHARLAVEDAAGVTPLMLACSIGDADLVQKISSGLVEECEPLAVFSHLNAMSHEGKSALYYAVNAGNYDCVKKLASFRVALQDNSSPVKDVMDSILGVEDERVGSATAPAVLLGSRCHLTGHDELTKVLMSNNNQLLPLLLQMSYRADGNHFVLDAQGKSVVHYALERNCSPVIDMLIPFKGKQHCKQLLSAQDAQGFTLLHHAVMKKSPRCIKSLIELGANVALCDNEKLSPLHHAVRLDNDELVEPFLAQPAAFNLQDCDGNTPFMCAVAGNQRDLIAPYKKVRNLGLWLMNHAGDTALHIAVRIKSPGMIRSLIYYYAIHAGAIPFEQKQTFLKGLLEYRNKEKQSVKELAALPGYESCHRVFAENGLFD